MARKDEHMRKKRRKKTTKVINIDALFQGGNIIKENIPLQALLKAQNMALEHKQSALATHSPLPSSA